MHKKCEMKMTIKMTIQKTFFFSVSIWPFFLPLLASPDLIDYRKNVYNGRYILKMLLLLEQIRGMNDCRRRRIYTLSVRTFTTPYFCSEKRDNTQRVVDDFIAFCSHSSKLFECGRRRCIRISGFFCSANVAFVCCLYIATENCFILDTYTS